jgi:hypothetical protein
MRFSSLLDRQERGEITREAAAEKLGVIDKTLKKTDAPHGALPLPSPFMRIRFYPEEC